MTLLSLTLTLFLIMDPLGNIKSFLKALEDVPASRQRMIIAREMAIALAFMLLFNLLGETIFSVLTISRTTVYLASGLILIITALSIIFPKAENAEPIKLGNEPLLVPLAIPLIAGPALLATIMLYADTEPNPWTSVLAILIAWAISSVILLSSKQVLRALGTSGLTACERLMGMVLILLGVDRMLQGIIHFMQMQ